MSEVLASTRKDCRVKNFAVFQNRRVDLCKQAVFVFKSSALTKMFGFKDLHLLVHSSFLQSPLLGTAFVTVLCYVFKETWRFSYSQCIIFNKSTNWVTTMNSSNVFIFHMNVKDYRNKLPKYLNHSPQWSWGSILKNFLSMKSFKPIETQKYFYFRLSLQSKR